MDDTASTHKHPHHGTESWQQPVTNGTANPNPKDKWDKGAMVLKFVGLLVIAAVIAGIGIFGLRSLVEHQETEKNRRLRSELMSRSAEAKASLDNEMVAAVIAELLKPTADQNPERMVLNLELLAHHSDDVRTLKPLLQQVYKKLSENPTQNESYLERLRGTTREIIDKQLATFGHPSRMRDGSVLIEDLAKPGNAPVLIEDTIRVTEILDQPLSEKSVKIEVASVDVENQTLYVRLIVGSASETKDLNVTVGMFDFPAVDNHPLPHGFHCALVLNNIDSDSAEVTFVYFPSSLLVPQEPEFLSTLKAPSPEPSPEPSKSPQP